MVFAANTAGLNSDAAPSPAIAPAVPRRTWRRLNLPSVGFIFPPFGCWLDDALYSAAAATPSRVDRGVRPSSRPNTSTSVEDASAAELRRGQAMKLSGRTNTQPSSSTSL